MSSIDPRKKVELLKQVLKSIHRGEDVSEIKKKFRELLAQVSPFEIPLIEQELVKEGIPIREILKLCDLHVELFREYLQSRELSGIPKGHPLDILLKENEYILKLGEALSLYANALARSKTTDEALNHIEGLKKTLSELKKTRIHYRKIQMGLFPYLERRGIIAVPRVLWGREDQLLVKIRELHTYTTSREPRELVKEKNRLVEKALEVAREISELVFRENKILYPAVWAMFSEGEWAAIKEVFDDIGYLVDVEHEWKPQAKPVYPYEIAGPVVTKEQLERLPKEMRSIIESRGITPDKYEIRRPRDLDLETGFLSVEEVKEIFNSLPLEITYADNNDRIRYYTHSKLVKGFIRTKTILARRVEFCHPPRLEGLVRKTINELKEGKKPFAEFWTKQGDRILRVLIVPVINKEGEYLGTIEIVEDLTEPILNPDKILRKIMVL